MEGFRRQRSDSAKLRNALAGLIRSPRLSLGWIDRGLLAKDRVFIAQTNWFWGSLPRVRLDDIFTGARNVEIVLPRPLDRQVGGSSVTLEEVGQLCAIVKSIGATRVLEIGTFDGNTTLSLAANVGDDGRVITVDLPADFDPKADPTSLTYYDPQKFNLTERSQLGRQLQNHPFASRVTQVFGDSGALDWSALGGPFDLVFIDGCHSEDYVRSDTRNALANLKTDGVVVWHDYGMLPDVSRVVDEFAQGSSGLEVYALEGTRLAIGFRAKRSH